MIGEIASSAGAEKVRIVCGRAKTDSLGGAAKEMAHVVGQIFEGISCIVMGRFSMSASENLVENDDIMAWTSSSLEARMRLDKEIPEPDFCHATINDCARIAVG